MLRIKNSLRTFGFLLALFVIGPIAGYAQGVKPPSDVNVVNTPNVNVTNAPDVKVTNTPKVLNANDLQPFQRTQSAVVSSLAEAVQVGFTVPQGKRLVIEFASIRVSTGPGGQEVSAVILAAVADAPDNQHQIVMSHQRSTSIGQVFAGAQQMRMYADPGTTVTLVTARSVSTGAALIGNLEITATISGYLVDLP